MADLKPVSSIRHGDTFVVESFASKRALTLRAELPGEAAADMPLMPGAVEWIDALTLAGGTPAQDGGHSSTRVSFGSPSIRQSFVGEEADVIEAMEAALLRESYTKLKTEFARHKEQTKKEVGNLREEIRLLCAPPPTPRAAARDGTPSPPLPSAHPSPRHPYRGLVGDAPRARPATRAGDTT